jgi:hypothetical protein
VKTMINAKASLNPTRLQVDTTAAPGREESVLNTGQFSHSCSSVTWPKLDSHSQMVIKGDVHAFGYLNDPAFFVCAGRPLFSLSRPSDYSIKELNPEVGRR